jgi:hypothetical protein
MARSRSATLEYDATSECDVAGLVVAGVEGALE